jgi:hypothetical protein
MSEDSGTARRKDKPARLSRGFVRCGGLIETQMRTAAAKRGFAQARLRALWSEIAGPEFAAICAPMKLARSRGPAGGLLTLAVSGPHAPQLQMLLPLLRERINGALGPGTVGRIQLTQRGGGFAEPAASYAANTPAPPQVDLAPLTPALSSIGDGELRGALETLARNVLSRQRKM